MTDELTDVLDDWVAATWPQLSLIPDVLRADAMVAYGRNATMCDMMLWMGQRKPAYNGAGHRAPPETPRCGLVIPAVFPDGTINPHMTQATLKLVQTTMKRLRTAAVRRVAGVAPLNIDTWW